MLYWSGFCNDFIKMYLYKIVEVLNLSHSCTNEINGKREGWNAPQEQVILPACRRRMINNRRKTKASRRRSVAMKLGEGRSKNHHHSLSLKVNGVEQETGLLSGYKGPSSCLNQDLYMGSLCAGSNHNTVISSVLPCWQIIVRWEGAVWAEMRMKCITVMFTNRVFDAAARRLPDAGRGRRRSAASDVRSLDPRSLSAIPPRYPPDRQSRLARS